ERGQSRRSGWPALARRKICAARKKRDSTFTSSNQWIFTSYKSFSTSLRRNWLACCWQFYNAGRLQAPSEVAFLAYEHRRRKITVENAIKITKSQTKLTAMRSDRSNLHLRPMRIHSQI